MEGFRLRPPVPRVLRRVDVLSTTIDCGSEELIVGKGTMLYLDVVSIFLVVSVLGPSLKNCTSHYDGYR